MQTLHRNSPVGGLSHQDVAVKMTLLTLTPLSCHWQGKKPSPKKFFFSLSQISALLPLMENKKLMIPGREDCIDVAPGFQFFATRRSDYSALLKDMKF